MLMQIGSRCLVVWGLCAASMVWAQTAPAKKPSRVVPPKAAVAASAPATAVAVVPPAGPSGKGWRSGPAPAWVVEPAAAPSGLAPAPALGGRRDQVFDVQANYSLPKPQTYIRLRSVALEAGALGEVSQPQIGFNPAFQSVVLHSVAVLRNGQRSERLAQARIDLLRREQALEQQVLDGTETLLVVVSDVRVGEPVEVVYTIEGENPIFEGRIATGARLAYDAPVELLHYRLTVPAGRELQVKTIGGNTVPERFTEGGQQVLRVLRHQVAGLPREQNTPVWFKAYPAVLVSEYRSWAEVDAWAQRLFALPVPTHPAVVARAEAFRATGLQGAALVSEVLRFVQDEVRYFSVSLGESSHRPHPPQQTLADLLGDCKDKVQLLNALLRELGFDAKPALVSVRRNRGLAEFLPGHDEFDHVITQLQLDGRSWLLDGTINGQGLTLASRGVWPYGRVLVVGGSGELLAAPEPADAVNRLEYEQRWNLASPGEPVLLTSVMRAHGRAAEQLRARVASAGAQRVAEPLAGAFARAMPGIEAVGEAEFTDDRKANVAQLSQRFKHAEIGNYRTGAIEAEFASIELLDVLNGPSEVRRRTPYAIDLPRLVESRIVVTAPVALPVTAATPVEVGDRHFRYVARSESAAGSVTFVRRLERRSDEVLPADLDSFRENMLKARGSAASSLRMPLFDVEKLVPDIQRLTRRVAGTKGWREDAFGIVQMGSEYRRFLDTKTLENVVPGSPLAARAFASRAQANFMLGDFTTALSDADAALRIRPQLELALETRAMALVGANRLQDSLVQFEQMAQRSRRSATLAWMGAVNYQLGQYAQAETLLREAVDSGAGRERESALLWLYLAAEAQGGRGQATLAPYVEGTDGTQFTGALLRYFNGTMDREAVLKLVREKPETERLGVVEVTFFVGHQFALRGQPEEAQRWFKRTLEAGGAAQMREVVFAQLAVQRAANPAPR